MKTFLIPFFFLCSLASSAQYYYNDIIGTLEMNRQMKVYQANKVKSVSATGYDQRGAKATGFSEYQEVKENGTALRMSSITNLSKTIIYAKYDAQGRVISSTDSSTAIESVTTYEYDAAGRITKIQNSTKDSANDFNQVEVHQWIYNAAGKPQKMWRIINSTDSLEIRFTPDENGNTGDERTFRKGRETGVIYYYYDDQKRLTDIVRFNTKAKKLLPDMLFEYDDNDRVIQKITTTSNLTLGYLIWRYIFDEKGLKTKEALFNDDKQLTGKIEYSYTFGQ
jgi:YD repeat-containing protein